ncbi:MAG: hypothetical protein KDB60_04850 [Propionibacteriaceae bacterium]|nr:hypothetical protein [Propionibacteriaceae bacterium]
MLFALLTAIATSACAASQGPLRLPDGSAGVCVNYQAAEPEPYWFGIPVENVTDRTVVLEQVTLDDPEFEIAAAFVVPSIRSSDGGSLSLGADRDPALNSPGLWAGGKQLRGFVLAAHERTSVGLGLSRAAGIQDARSRAQRFRFHYDDDSTSRASVSEYEIRIAPECG